MMAGMIEDRVDVLPVLTVTSDARATVLEVLANESDPASLALWLEISGVGEATRGAPMLVLLEEHPDPEFAALRAAHLVADEWDADAEFARGLEVVLTGLRASLAPTAS